MENINAYLKKNPGACAIVYKNGVVQFYESEYEAMYIQWEDKYLCHDSDPGEVMFPDEIDYTGKKVHF